MFSAEFKSYENCFDSKNVKILFTYENKNHVIELKLNKELLYDPLYALFEKKFQILRDYLLNNLALNHIREFFNLVKVSILFIFKKNDNLRLCVNYRNLNANIIKTKYFLSFVKKTFDRLMSAVYFTQFEFKNIYHRIRICKNNE